MLRFSFSGFVLVFFLMLVAGNEYGFSQNLSQQKKDSLLNNWQSVPGTDIMIIPPAYFKPFTKDGKFGFMHEGAAASISIQEIKGTAYVMVVKALTKQYIESQGMKFISSEDIKTKKGNDGTIIAVGFSVKSTDGKQTVDYERLMLFTGDYRKTVWVQANYPVVAKKVLYNVMRESLLSVTY